ncbi:Predicted Fe-Mo cluster-binding protein, NifX family [Fervidobacterium changbaicum]|uniref:NifB/NifX family molybdenum-iron cluster-binding protein n=2 Tax=Fervidobacterium TaxID=2422 RepID=A0AAI8CMW6_FERIS|nr:MULTISPECIES: NifB/NifX family molybdenum-iron cluster-binding protein [Fervidobacterium]AMW33417.1 NifB/NifX family molybdenum-iron cluster-binding protein [Fervidobacterium islandicum]QAV33465.1 dinitrogenase iron-molybdenum cofactor biosynthesis protein [Fervidobacterium changbaicum]SDH15128.1 Predicted Fe-Mo cluster-binding protein, NifX family [Fervidobacterium changbaicum]
MRFVIPTDDGNVVADHFGRAMYFMKVEIKDGKEISRILVDNLHARSHGNHGHHGHYEPGHHEHAHGYGHGREFGHEHEHGHGHEEVFASTGEIDAVVAVRIGPHMFEDLKERGVDIYLVKPRTSINEIVSKMLSGELKKLELRK